MLTYPKSTMRVRRIPMHLSSGHVNLMSGKFYLPLNFSQSDLVCRADSRWALPQISSAIVFSLTGAFKVWNLFGLIYSSHSDSLTDSGQTGTAASESQQVVTSAFYCKALDAICVTTHEQNIVFYHCDGLKQFKQVSL